MASEQHESKGTLVADPDLHEAARLMNLAWARPCWRYSEDLLAEYLHRPSGDRALSLAWRKEDRILGFFAGMPIDVESRHGAHRALFTSFLTVHPEARDPSMPSRLFARVVEEARRRGVTHVYTVFHHDEATNRFVRRLFQLGRCEAHDLLEFAFLTRPINLRPKEALAPDARIIEYEKGHGSVAAALLAEATSQIPLRQMVPPGDLDGILASRSAITRLFVRRGKVVGFVAGRLRDVQHVRTLRHLHLDFLALGGLVQDEQDALLADVAAAAANADVEAIVAPELGYFDAAPLRRNGFVRFTSKAVLAVAELSATAAKIEPVGSAFFEVF